MRLEECGIVLDAALSVREALSKSLTATAFDATIARLTSNPAMEMMQRFNDLRSNPIFEMAQRLGDLRKAHTLPDYVLRAASWSDTAHRLPATSTIDVVAGAHDARIEADAILRRAGFTDDLRARFSASTCALLEPYWMGLPSHAHDLLATRVLPEIASTQQYLAATNFTSLRASLGASVATALEQGLRRPADLFEAHVSATLPSLARVNK